MLISGTISQKQTGVARRGGGLERRLPSSSAEPPASPEPAVAPTPGAFRSVDVAPVQSNPVPAAEAPSIRGLAYNRRSESMAKALKVISINFQFEDRFVEYSHDLAIDEALFDFDIVGIRPFALVGPGHRRGRGARGRDAVGRCVTFLLPRDGFVTSLWHARGRYAWTLRPAWARSVT
jgi:hypothetical protein